MRSAALRELRNLFPGAVMHCYVDAVGAEALSLSHDPYRVVKVVNRSKRNRPLYLWRKALLHWNTRIESFDLFVDFYNGPSSRRLLLNSNSRRVLFIRDSKVISIPPSRAVTTRTHSNTHHLSNLYFRMLGHLYGTTPCSPDVRPWVGPKTVRDHHTKFDHRHYFVSLATGDPRKNPPLELMRQLAGWLHSERGLIPIIACNPGQENLQKDFEQYLLVAGIPFLSLEPLGLTNLLSIMESVRLSILPDTGLFHLAVAAGRPLFGIFTHTHPQLVDPHLPHVKFAFIPNDLGLMDQNGLRYGTKEIPLTLAIQNLKALLSNTECS